jgi:hypothetical protein
MVRHVGDIRTLLRVIARALLETSPQTLVSTKEIALVLGRDEHVARAARPETAQRPGAAYVAPWGEWRASLDRFDGYADPGDEPPTTGRAWRPRRPPKPTPTAIAARKPQRGRGPLRE